MGRRFGFCSHLNAALPKISHSMIQNGNPLEAPQRGR